MTRDDEMAIRQGVRVILDRRERAQQAFRETIGEILSGESRWVDGRIIADWYIKEKVARFDGQRYTVKHGGFLDPEVLARALHNAVLS